MFAINECRQKQVRDLRQHRLLPLPQKNDGVFIAVTAAIAAATPTTGTAISMVFDRGYRVKENNRTVYQ
jgi:hypothetical protein